MSPFSPLFESRTSLMGGSIALTLVLKWTAVLAPAWMIHASSSRCNPRWRVLLWRATVAGLAVVAISSWAPPIVEYCFTDRGSTAIDVARSQPSVLAEKDRKKPEVLGVSVSAEAANPPPSLVLDAATTNQSDSAQTSPGLEPVPTVRETRWDRRLSYWLPSIWLAGVVVFISRLMVGSLILARLVRQTSEVPDWIVGECRAIAGRLGCSRAVRVRRSTEVTTPFLTGVWHPVLMLPRQSCPELEAKNEDLRAILAHELTHARNHDLFWNLAASLASIVLWFHPLAWRIRAMHASACDAVCDAVAADTIGDVASYGRTLARLALHAAQRQPAQGLAMARACDVRRRLDALNRKVFRSAISPKRTLAALLAAGLILVLIGGFGFTRAERAQAVQANKTESFAQVSDQKKVGKLTLRAVSAETNQSIEGVSIEYWVRIGENIQEATITTGEDGTAAIEWPADATVNVVGLTATMPKLVPIHMRFDDRRQPLKLPDVKELRFEAGTTIGGIIQDEAGHPVPGVKVDIHAQATEYEGGNYFFSLGSPMTDAQGRWRLDAAPKNLAGVWGRTSHPHFRNSDVTASRNLDSVVVVKKGLSVTGRVVDGSGKPIKWARAVIGHDIWGTNPPTATTNEQGEFTLENCVAGPSIITVQADGFAPRIQDVRIDERTAPVEFRLNEPGSVLRIRVVDVQGNAVAGARLFADTWRGHRSITFQANTDANGRIEWGSAPKDAVLYDWLKQGYMPGRRTALTASEREQTVILYPELKITGRVTDATTGQPVPKFRVVKGWQSDTQDRIAWFENMGVDVIGGRYTILFNESREALFVKIEAPGYIPAHSRAFAPNEGSQTLDFKLKPDAGLSGVVLLPDGKPAEGAEVAVVTWQSRVRLRSGRFEHDADVPKVTTGPDGQFAFPSQAGEFLLMSLSDAGYADASSTELKKSNKLVLLPWGTIEGGARIGPRFGPNEQVVFYPTRPEGRVEIGGWGYGYTTRTDERGRFRFDRVVPGPGTVARVVGKMYTGGLIESLPCWQETITVKPGETSQATIGGKGRPLVGRVTLDGTPESPVDWTQSESIMLGVAPPVSPGQARRGMIRHSSILYASTIDKDSRFRIEDVPAGKYELELTVNGARDPRFSGPGREIAYLRMPVVVPEISGGRSNEPLDLGTITAKLFDAWRVGDLAPDFDVEPIGTQEKGQRLKLSDFRGKLVLLDFWDPSYTKNDMTVLKEVQANFGKAPRFVIISLACGKNIAGAEPFIKKNNLSWIHGAGGDFDKGVGPRYKVRAIPYAQLIGPDQRYRRNPTTFLIGPDGKMLGHDLRGDDLEAVRKAMENPKLFPVAAAPARRSGSQ
jgi:beta-lactamase regulating signal transducer with metallopeptidase domain/protocatechuate 3,4-dioxygenase beta subunit/peroxiredoxin